MDMHAEFGKAIDYAGGGYGVAVLSRWPIVSRENHPLPISPFGEPRTALTVRVRAGEQGPLLQFTSTHLDHGRNAEGRMTQARYLNQLLVPGRRLPSNTRRRYERQVGHRCPGDTRRTLDGCLSHRSGTVALFETAATARLRATPAGDPLAGG